MNECLRRCFLWGEYFDLLSQPAHLEARPLDLQWDPTLLFTAKFKKDLEDGSGAQASLGVRTTERALRKSGAGLHILNPHCRHDHSSAPGARSPGAKSHLLHAQFPLPVPASVPQTARIRIFKWSEGERYQYPKRSQLWTNAVKPHSNKCLIY